MKKVMKQVQRKHDAVVIDLAPAAAQPVAEEPKTEEPKAEEAKAEEAPAEPKAEEAQPVADAEEHKCDDSCDHAGEEATPKRSRKKQAEPSDAE